MEVYIEYVILDNLIINYLILYLTKTLLKIDCKKIRLFLVSLLGCVFAIFMPFIVLNTTFLFLIKLCVGAILVLCVCKFKSVKDFFITYLLFLTFTFVLGGCCFGFMFMFGGSITINGLLINGFEFPMSVFILFIFIYVYWLIKLIGFYKKQKSLQKFKYKVKVYADNKEYEMEAFLDSGNRIYDEEKPVFIISIKTFHKLFKVVPTQSLVLQKVTANQLKNAHYICVGAVNGKSKMLVFNIDKIEIKKEQYVQEIFNPSIGLAFGKFHNDFEMLLHPDCF